MVIDAIRRFFASRDDVAAAWVFGSEARGTARAASDVDVAVLLKRDTDRTLLDSVPAALEEDLTRVCGGRRVDVVLVNRASPDLVHRVLRDGVLVAEHDRSRRVAFEVKKRNEYFDLKPHLDRYRAAVLR